MATGAELLASIVCQNYGLQWLLDPPTGRVIARSRGATNGNVEAGNFHELAVGHSLASWQEIARPLLSGDKESLTLGFRLNLDIVEGQGNIRKSKGLGAVLPHIDKQTGEDLSATEYTGESWPKIDQNATGNDNAAEDNGYGSLQGVQALVDFQFFSVGAGARNLVATAHPIRDTCNCKYLAATGLRSDGTPQTGTLATAPKSGDPLLGLEPKSSPKEDALESLRRKRRREVSRQGSYENEPKVISPRNVEAVWHHYDDAGVVSLILRPDTLTVTSCSSGVETLFGVPPHHLVEKAIQDVILPEDWSWFQGDLAHLCEGEGGRGQWDVRCLHIDGRQVWVRFTLSTLAPPRGSLLLVLCEDVSELKEVEECVLVALEPSKAVVSVLDLSEAQTPSLRTGLSCVVHLLDRYRQLFLLYPHPCLLYSTDLRIVDCNEAALRILHVEDKKDLLGIPRDVLWPDRQQDGQLSLAKSIQVRSGLRLGWQTRIEWDYKNMKGAVVPTITHALPMVIQGQVMTWVVWSDLREARQAEKELRAAKEEAEAANRAKGQFLANMSHEIRTPMNGVLGVAEVLLRTQLTEEQREYCDIIRSSGDSLLRIISDVLDLSKIESDNLGLEFLPFDLRVHLREALALLEVVAGDKGLKIESWCHPDVPRWVVGDLTRIRQVLLNLASNSLKFTERGGLWVNVRMATPEEDHDRMAAQQKKGGGEPKVAQLPTWKDSFVLYCEVKDSGMGVGEEVRSKLFQAFMQGDSSTSRRFGGTGLGLAISKLLVHLMGGHIGCSSEVGKGSTFFFTLKLGRGSAGVPLPPTSPSRVSLPALRVLLAEDNKVNQLVAVRILRDMGVAVDVAHNGVQALEACRQAEYDLVLMDCHMPEMDGFEATTEIRALESRWVGQPKRKRTLIVALTASALSHERERCKEVGMDHFLTKPIRPKDIEDFLHKHLVPNHSLKEADLPPTLT